MPELDHPLKGQRVALGVLNKSHAHLYADWINDPAVKGGFLDNGVYTVEDEERFIDGLQADAAQADPSGVRFEIHDLASAAPIGLTGLFDISWRHRSAELAISIGPAESRGKGLGTEAIRLTLQWAFEVLSLHSVGISTIDLEQGERCFTAAGFKLVGRRRESVLAAGQLRDAIVMDALASDFTR